jgi:hypothetical protein
MDQNQNFQVHMKDFEKRDRRALDNPVRIFGDLFL